MLDPLIIGAADLATIAALISEDKKVSLGEVLVSLPSAISAINKLVSVDYSKVEDDLKSASDDDKARYAKLFKDHFDLKDDNVEKSIEAGFAIVIPIGQALLKLIDSLNHVAAGVAK